MHHSLTFIKEGKVNTSLHHGDVTVVSFRVAIWLTRKCLDIIMHQKFKPQLVE